MTDDRTVEAPSAESLESLVGRVADEFLIRQERGERPDPEEYAARYPGAADLIRRTLAALRVAAGSLADGAVPAGAAPPAPRFVGDYLIGREIGRGGMGVVYEAEQVSLGRRVALKLLTQRLLTDDKQRKRFEREAKSAAKLHHTNIVPVHGYGEHDGSPYYVMQFIPGAGLDVVVGEVARMEGREPPAAGPLPATKLAPVAAVARSLVTGEFHPDENATGPADGATGTFTGRADDAPSADAPAAIPAPERDVAASTDEFAVTPSGPLHGLSSATSGRNGRRLTYWQGVARIGVQVADALEYAHRQGVIHRDIKPSNLLLDLAGTVWVTDFGLAKAEGSEDLTHTGDVLGTLRYMPPEAFEGRADARSDVYSLGLTLYELCALCPAFDERDRNKLIKQVTTGEPAPLRHARPGVPRDLETIVRKAIDRDPARRYPTAGELAADLQRFVDDEPIRARRQSNLEAGWRLVRRHPMIAASLALAMGALVAVAAVSTALLFQTQAAEQAQARNADDLRDEQKRTEAEKVKVQVERDKAREVGEERAVALRGSARLAYSRGRQLAEEGEVGAGLLWMARALETVPPGPDDLDREIRLNIEAWAPYAIRLRRAVPLELWGRMGENTGPQGGQLVDFNPGWWLMAEQGRETSWTEFDDRLVAPGAGHGVGSALAGTGGVLGFSTDGGQLLVRVGQNQVRVVDTVTGALIGQPLDVPAPDSLVTAGFVPGGQLVYTAGRQQVRFWDPVSGKAVGPTWWGRSVRFWPEGHLAVLVGSADGKSHARGISYQGEGKADPRTLIRFIDTTTGAEKRDPITLPIAALQTEWADLADDGRVAVVHLGEEILLLDPAGKQIGRFPIPHWLTAHDLGSAVCPTALSPDRRAIWVLAPRKWWAYDARTGKPLDVPAPDEKRLDRRIVLGRDRAAVRVGSRLWLWDTATGKPVGEPIPVSGPAVFAFTGDGRTLVAVLAATEVRRWDAGTGRPSGLPLVLPAPSKALAISADGRHLLRADGERRVALWDLDTGKILGGTIPLSGEIDSIGFVPGGRGFVIGAHETVGSVVYLYDFPWNGPRHGPEVSPSLNGFLGHPGYSKDGSRFEAVVTPVEKATSGGVSVDVPGSRQTLLAWESGTGRPLAEVDLKPWSGGVRVRRTTAVEWQVWDVPGGRAVGDPVGQEFKLGRGMGEFSSDGLRLFMRNGPRWPYGYLSKGTYPQQNIRYQVLDATTGRPTGAPVEVPGNKELWGGWIGNRLYLVTRVRADEHGGPAEIRDAESGRVVGKADHLGELGAITRGSDGCVLFAEEIHHTETLEGGGTKDVVVRQARIFRLPANTDGMGQWVGDPAPMASEGRSLWDNALRQDCGVSPGHRFVALWAPEPNRVAIYSLADGKRVAEPLVIAGLTHIESLAVDDTGELLAATGILGTTYALQIWDVRSGKPLAEPLRLGGRPLLLSFVPGGTDLVLKLDVPGPDRTPTEQVLVLDGRTGRTRHGPHIFSEGAPGQSRPWYFSQAVSADGKLLTGLSGRGMETTDLVTGKKAMSGRVPVEGNVVAWHLPSGRLLLSTETSSCDVLGEDGQPLGPTIRSAGQVTFSGDGRRALVVLKTDRSGIDGSVQVFDVATGRPLGEPLKRDGWQVVGETGVRFSPAGDVVVGVTQRVLPPAPDQVEECWWDAATGKILGTAPSEAGVERRFSDKGTFMTLHQNPRGGAAEWRLWDTASGKVIHTITLPKGQQVRSWWLSPSGIWFYSIGTRGASELYGRDIRTGELVVGPLAHPGDHHGEQTPDGQLLITQSGNQLRIWDLRTGRLLGRPWDTGASFSLHPGGRLIVTAVNRRPLQNNWSIQEWALPQITTESPAAITQRLEAVTGLRLDADGVVHPLSVK